MEIYLLTCSNASSLGGPMGTERTVPMWTRPYSSMDRAKRASGHPHDEWNVWETGTLTLDFGGGVTYAIQRVRLDDPPPSHERG